MKYMRGAMGICGVVLLKVTSFCVELASSGEAKQF